MTMTSCFIEPLDVLFLRGNKLFGDPGSYGESLVPPWPSVAAGALRSRMLADDRSDFNAFARGEVTHPTLGMPTEPGSFSVAAFHLARRFADGRVELLFAPPADLVIGESDGSPVVRSLTPNAIEIRNPLPPGEGRVRANGSNVSTALPQALSAPGPHPNPSPAGEGLNSTQLAIKACIQSSFPLALLPVLAETKRSKSAGGYWLSEAGWKKYLAGETPAAADLVKSSALWAIDHRVGVGLDAEQRRAADGKLFSVQAVAMKKAEHGAGFDVGFLAAISGADLPKGGLLRLGGDGRAAALHDTAVTLPETDYTAIAQHRRCRIVLTTPGIFAEGWLPTGVTRQDDGSLHFALHGVRGRLVCAAVPRFDTISGWDLAEHKPKPAQRVAPIGSVYWLDELDATAESLGKLAAAGLWGEPCEDAVRRAEGFNRFAFAAY
jgi:CRISPR-associated protein Cmr3